MLLTNNFTNLSELTYLFLSNEEVGIKISSILTAITLFLLTPSFAQDNSKYDALNKRMEELSKQLDLCGDDIDCVVGVTNQMNQVIKEVQALHKTDPYITGETTSDDFLNELPSLKGEFPPEFQTLTELWLKHELAATKDLRLNCEVIENTKEAVIDEVLKIYKEGKGSLGQEWPLPLYDCMPTYVNLKEHGTLDEPDFYYLTYNLEFSDEAVWAAYYALTLGNEHIGVYEDYSYKLGLSNPSNRKCAITNFSGWIIDDSNDPPIQLALNRYTIFRQEDVEPDDHSTSYEGYTRIYPNNVIEDPKDKFPLLGKVTEYRLLLPHQIVRFFPASNPELYVENTILLTLLSEVTDEIFTLEEVQKYFADGKFRKTYGFGDITQELEIGYPPIGCDFQPTSEQGAIVLSNDCIDHRGYVVASDTT
ncbi:MAG: hypothetical protein HKM87_10815, partial [Ignavibacteriaceae bacterium]|nr:hypothetical protein [Ignavibacteriaceae bacterium]